MMSTVALSTGSPWILLYMDLDDGSCPKGVTWILLLQLVRRLSKLGINEDDQPNFVKVNQIQCYRAAAVEALSQRPIMSPLEYGG